MDVKQTVKQYYGATLQRTTDLKTGACCTGEAIPEYIKKVLPLIDDEIQTKYYGCGSPIPLHIKGLNVLDIGCGTGRDCYIMSTLVGEDGFVHGIDMTENQLAVAKSHIEEQTRTFGFKRPNVRFILDTMERIDKHFTQDSLNLVTSNCVLNLAEDKELILQQIHHVLQPGGEFYFSDIYADRRVPDEVKNNEVLYGECLGGALYDRDFERIARKVGFSDPRVVVRRVLPITNASVKRLVGTITFYSITYRLWKLEGLEESWENYGQTATYLGGLPESPTVFGLDESNVFERNRPASICRNTALMLTRTRFKPFFKVMGDANEHLGAFMHGSATEGGSTRLKPKKSCC
jgi:ubiquinone/menaquinone biosynthesis C-methylase UbiE